MKFAGVVLAGGASRRMGCDKAQLAVHGESLLARQVRVLRGAGAGPVMISGRRERRYDMPGSRFVPDAPGVEGPMAGVLAALRSEAGSHLAVAAVDLPRLGPVFFQRLWCHCGAGRGAVAVCDGRFEPLAAIYPATLVPALEAAARARRFSLQEALRSAVACGRMAAVSLTADECTELANTNTPEEFRNVVA